MKEFNTIPEAFEWFMENVFPTLSTEAKIKLKDVKYDYYKRDDKKVSEKRMVRAMNENGRLEVAFRYYKEGEE